MLLTYRKENKTPMTRQHKVILNVHVANNLIKRGFHVVEVKPSNKIRGRAVFIFDLTPEFDAALTNITQKGF